MTGAIFQIGVLNGLNGRQSGRDFLLQAVALLQEVRGIIIHVVDAPSEFSIHASTLTMDVCSTLSAALSCASHHREADVVEHVRTRCIGANPVHGPELTDTLFLLESHLHALNSEDRSTNIPPLSPSLSPSARPMTLAEKIIAHHCVGGPPPTGIRAGAVLRVALDWVIASELTWTYMHRTMQQMGVARTWRNDRFWLVADHVVDPGVYASPKVQALIEAVERARVDYKMTEYQGVNTTIMHTEFVRARVQPGMFVLGADSHTCSSGAVGALAIGLGAGDVAMGLVTGQTWLKVPESIRVVFVGEPAFGVGGKDVILHILRELRRNTVAAGRIVEFDGPGLRHLSIDARFAIANMCAVTGIFAADEITQAYIYRRPMKMYRSRALYFRADDNAEYAGTYTTDLAKVQPTMAVHPAPDAVVPVGEMTGMQLDGVFIGVCTTTEEDIVLAALVLKTGLAMGLAQDAKQGRRHVVPGSLPIIKKLRSFGLLAVYEAAGFTIGVPGCSFCVGMGSDRGAEGEVWLSSQNRNFKNRMGKGVVGHITSAAVVAASSFSMSVTDPAPFLARLDTEFWPKYKEVSSEALKPVTYVEPHVGPLNHEPEANAGMTGVHFDEPEPMETIRSKVVVLGDFIDTDAIAPSEFLIGPVTDEELGTHCLQFTHPDFRDKVKNWQRVVVAGKAFGCGSSRQHAVGCLTGAGVQAVIERSFSFIYGRNQPTLGLLGIIMTDEAFYEAAIENVDIEVDVRLRKIRVAGLEFPFSLSEIEYRLTMHRGMVEAYKKFGDAIWERMTEEGAAKDGGRRSGRGLEEGLVDARLRW